MTRYQVENNRLKALFAGGNWSENPKIARADAIRLDFAREHGSAIALNRWLTDEITWKKLWRIISEAPGEYERQVEMLSEPT